MTVFAGTLESQYRAWLGERATPSQDDVVRFAVAFASLVVRILPDEVDLPSLQRVARAIEVHTTLGEQDVQELLRMALEPEHRTEVLDEELLAFGARFGGAAEKAMRSAVGQELDLEGFAEAYGPGSAMLLIDSLFWVLSADGLIDDAEIGRLQDAARRLQVDPKLVSLLFHKHDARHASNKVQFALTGLDEVVIGREAPASLILPDPQVARQHVRLERVEGGWHLFDLSSGRPTWLDGRLVRKAPLQHLAEIRVGPFRLLWDSHEDIIKVFDSHEVSALSVRGLKRTIEVAGREIVLLDQVDFTAFTGEVVAVVGPSGSGKTTLLNAITGVAPPDEGQVLLDQADFHDMLVADRSLVGIVPQDDVVHAELTVEESLNFAARLRLREDVDAADVDAVVQRVVTELGLEDIRGQRVGGELHRGISGGQRKRVSLGQELLTQTTRVLFLDEPTSGLDPATSQDIVVAMRQLADDGRLVFLVTHDVSPSLMTMVDHLLVLAPGGRVAWFGPPSEAIRAFDVQSVSEIFVKLGDDSADVWAARYRESAAYRKYVRTRQHLFGLTAEGDDYEPVVVTPRSQWNQYVTLVRRYATVKRRDVTGIGVLLAQAPVLGIALAIVFPQPDVATLFVMVLSSLWFGASASVRELIAERAIWRREARVGLRLIPYMASKITVLAGFVAVQCLVLSTILWAALSMIDYGYDFGALAAVNVATGMVGLSIGLLVSSMFSSSEAAVGTLPLVLIPQIAFGGLIVKVKEMGVMAKAISYLMVTRFGFEAAIKTGEELAKPAHKGLGSSSEHIRRFLWELGFRSADADDMGIAMPLLAGILVGFFVVFVSIATWATGRTAESE